MAKSTLLFLLIAIFCLSTKCIAQSGYRDVVYLKNGSVIHGIIIEQVLGKSLKIQTSDESVFVFQETEIEKIAKEKIKVDEFRQASSGYFGLLQIGPSLTLGSGASTKWASLVLVNGVHLLDNFTLGLGLGFDYEFADYGGSRIVPAFIDFRGYIPSGGASPYALLDIGYGYEASTNTYVTGGLLIGFGIGIKAPTGPSTAFCIDLGYRSQSFTVAPSYYYSSGSLSSSFGLLMLHLGYSF